VNLFSRSGSTTRRDKFSAGDAPMNSIDRMTPELFLLDGTDLVFSFQNLLLASSLLAVVFPSTHPFLIVFFKFGNRLKEGIHRDCELFLFHHNLFISSGACSKVAAKCGKQQTIVR
jgi:hypothetical protein